MAKKKKASKKVAKKQESAKNVTHAKGKENVVKEVLVDVPDDPQQEAVPAPAIAKERTLKVVSKGGRIKYYTQSEYDKEFS